MAPNLTFADGVNKRLTDAVVGCDHAQKPCVGADAQDSGSGEFGLSVAFAAQRCAAPFSHHVVNVVLVCAKKEMARFNARRNVALVTNVQALRNRAAGVNPGQPMRKLRTPIPSHAPIAVGKRAGPEQASIFSAEGAESQAFPQWHVAPNINSAIRGHSRNLSTQRVVGQGRDGVGSAARPAHYALSFG